MPHVKTDGRERVPDAFVLRCHARAKLWQDGEIHDLHDAVDPLQAWAIQTGLVKTIGQDAVQAIMAEAFAAVRSMPDHVDQTFAPVPPPPIPDDPNYHLVARHGVASAEDMQAPQNAAIRRRSGQEAAQSTVEALMFCLREQGADALENHKNIDRLDKLSTAQLRNAIERLVALRQKTLPSGRQQYPAITDDLITRLGDLL